MFIVISPFLDSEKAYLNELVKNSLIINPIGNDLSALKFTESSIFSSQNMIRKLNYSWNQYQLHKMISYLLNKSSLT